MIRMQNGSTSDANCADACDADTDSDGDALSAHAAHPTLAFRTIFDQISSRLAPRLKDLVESRSRHLICRQETRKEKHPLLTMPRYIDNQIECLLRH